MSNKQNAKDSKLKVQVSMRICAMVVLLIVMCATVSDSLSQTKRRITKPKDAEPQISDRGAATATRICHMTVEQFPAIRGFRLGMTLVEVKRHFVTGFEEAHPDKFGMVTVSLTKPASTTFPVAMNPNEFAGLFQLGFIFYEGRLIEASYEYTPAKWRHIREFITIASPALNIGSAQWQVIDTGTAKLDCVGFMVQMRLLAFSSQLDMPKIIVTDMVAMAAATKRKGDAMRQNEEEQRRAFRP